MIFLYIILAFLLVLLIIKRSTILALYAKIQYYGGKKEKGLKLFKLADKIGTLAPENRMQYGFALLRVGHLDEARTHLNSAFMSAKSDSLKNQIKSILSLALWKDGNIDEAIEMLEEVIRDFKTTAVYQNLGLMYVLKGDTQKALSFNLEAFDYNSDDLVIADNLAESYMLCNEQQKAFEIYEELLTKEPHFPEPYYNYGRILVEKGEKERGIALIKQSLTKTFSFLSENPKEYVEKLLLEKEAE